MNSNSGGLRMILADNGDQWQDEYYLPLDGPRSTRIEHARRRLVEAFISPFVGSGADTLVYRIDYGNHFLCCHTRSSEPITDLLDRLDGEYGLRPRGAGGPLYSIHPHVGAQYCLAENFRRFEEAGFDPWEFLVESAHSKGLEIFLGLHLNADDHEPFYREGCSLRASHFLLEHPEFMIGETGQEQVFRSQLDFARQEVRDNRLAAIEELCGRYDIDGLELDFTFGSLFFKDGEAAAGSELMNGFMSRVRQIAADAGGKRGHSIQLLARFDVLGDLETTREQVGLDPATWVAEGTVDLLAPRVMSTVNEHVEAVRQCVALVPDTECRVLPSTCPATREPLTGIVPSLEMVQSANMNFRRVGAAGYHLHWPRTNRFERNAQKQRDYSILRRITCTDEQLARESKHYIVAHENFSSSRLPLRLVERRGAVAITIGDDVESAVADNAIEEVRLVIGLRHFTPEDEVSFRLNGVEIPWDSFTPPEYAPIWYVFGRLEAQIADLGCLRRGDNELEVIVDKHVPDPDGMYLEAGDLRRPDCLVLTNLELFIKYRGN